MKIAMLTILGVYIITSLRAQDRTVVYKAITIVAPTDHLINGGIRSHMGGVSRIFMPIILPTGTIGFYYSVSASATIPLGTGALSSQIQDLLSKGMQPRNISSQLTIPQGTGICDIYLMPAGEGPVFESKTEQHRIFPASSRTNVRQAIVEIDRGPLSPLAYTIGLKNPSATDAINVSIEVCAIVKEVTQTKDQERPYALSRMSWDMYEKGDIKSAKQINDQALDMNPNCLNCYLTDAYYRLISNDSTCLTKYAEAIAYNPRDESNRDIFRTAKRNVKDAIKRYNNLKYYDSVLAMLKD